MNLSQDPHQPSASTPIAHGHIRCAPGVLLSTPQLDLLAQAFDDVELIFVKREFRSGYSGALVLLVSLGAERAPVVVKLAHPLDLEREYQAYQQFVRQISPQNIAHLQGEPLLSPDRQLGLIQYSFAGGDSHQAATSLHDYYNANGGSACAIILNRIFRAYGRYWWANNRPHLYTLGEQYDRLLPVHLQVQMSSAAPESEPAYILEPGKTSVVTLRQIDEGQIIRLIGFQVTKITIPGQTMTLVAAPPPNEASAPLRIRLELDEPLEQLLRYRIGDTIDQLDAVVVATRLRLICRAAEEAVPGYKPYEELFIADVASSPEMLNGITQLNPMFDLSGLLDRVVESKASIIHGDLNLQNVLVDTPTGFAWIIDFGETRRGPTLLDLQRLEVQVVTKLLPAVLRQAQLAPPAVAEMLVALHADHLPVTPPHAGLHEPFQVLSMIRRLARQYMIDDLDWDEYYLGLIVTLLGALKYEDLDALARNLALVAAATARGLLGHRLEVGHQAAPGAVTAGGQAQEGVSMGTPADAIPPSAPAVTPVPSLGLYEHSQEAKGLPSPSKTRFIGIGAGVLVMLVVLFAVWQLRWVPGIGAPDVIQTPGGVATSTSETAAESAATTEPVATATTEPAATDAPPTATETSPVTHEVLVAGATPTPPEASVTPEDIADSIVDPGEIPTLVEVLDLTEGELNRNNPDHVRSLQVALNDILDLQLEADGVIGTETSDAIRSFQERAGLRVDGIVSPETVQALVAALTSDAAVVLPPQGYSAGETWENPVDNAIYVFVPEGAFEMGVEGEGRDVQLHTVYLSSFWIMRTEVTNAQYKLCVDAGVCTPPLSQRWGDPDYDDHPVTEVTWDQASTYAHWVGGRLPSDAEWEKAARGTDGRIYPWGDELPNGNLLNFSRSMVAGTVPVGSYPAGASPYGVLDMAGNVEEWVADWYDPNYLTNSPERDPTGPEEGTRRVLRGGSYTSNVQVVRTFNREPALPGMRLPYIGFRVAISPQ